MITRQDKLEHYRLHPEVSVLIIGAGVNGIGTFRDLALQGIDVLMVDKQDFCAGASMASSHMLHGGIRYLENGEFRLVREALHERNRLLRNAPHLARPLPTAIPIYRWFSGLLNAPLKFVRLLDKPAERGALVIKIGLIFYDLFVKGDSPMPPHKFYAREAALAKWPQVNKDVRFIATYFDGAMPSPERICVELIRDAEADCEQAHALNYVSAVGATADSVTLRDEETGETFDVKPQVVVNAAGPWIDFANDALGKPTNFIGGTKGSHLIIDYPALRAALGDHEFFFEYLDGRIVLIYPYEDKVMIGTTDIFIENPDDARCTDEEIDYILGMVPKVFPNLKVGREHIIFQFSGVRPLPASDASRTGQISRDHSLRVVEPGEQRRFPILSLVGGKWTSYRAFSEQTTDAVLARLGKTRRSSTADQPIGGGRDYPKADAQRADWLARTAQETGVTPERMETLFYRYGTGAAAIAAYMTAGEDAPFQTLPDYTRREIAYLAQQEQVVHLDDMLLRRSLIAWMGQASSAAALTELAGAVGEPLGWDAARQAEEVRRTAAIFADQHAVEIALEGESAG
ncbi:MAG: glycerol-3-phosphate dehydrogenase/oxidase [Anaerolineae bacterium]|nr:glycerol-3-phosphate dehydrogenase/oxidase [Anaerolineae bacterium]